jgi:ribonuclease J
MRFKIHRGTKEIGGSCVEVWTDTTRIVIDFGMPLVNVDRTSFDPRKVKTLKHDELTDRGILPDIPSLFQDGSNTALLISHAHQDHYGLINYVSPDCPIYLGEATLKLIELTNAFINRDWAIKNPHHFESGKSFTIGDIAITPYLMDHAAFDAYAFMIQANGKSLFYSGDFRIHGRKKKAFDWFSYHVEKGVDYLLLEGTSIGRQNTNFPTEDEIEKSLIETFKQTNGINLIYCSGQNIDRLVSIYRACKQTGKTFVIDFYIANVLRDLAKLGYGLPYPSEKFPEIKVRFPSALVKMIINRGQGDLAYRFTQYKITTPEIIAQYKKVVVTVRPSMTNDVTHFKKLSGGTLIYSQWGGYKKEKYVGDFLEYLSGKGMTIKDIHTSGHADLAGLKKMVEVLQPKCIVPIHTFEGDEYEKLFTGTKVKLANDREEVTI